MSEEEIISEYTYIINSTYLQGYIKDHDGNTSNILREFYSLYEQEKAKNKETEIELEKTTELLTTCNKRLEEISRTLGLTEEHQYGYSYSEIKQYIETLIDENNRLENIEDKKIQIEYELVFNKGVKSVKNKIKEKIEEYNKIRESTNDDDIYDAMVNYIDVLNDLLLEEDLNEN